MDLPTELFVRQLENDSDIVAFNFPFQLEAKALEDGTPGNIVTELDDGDLIIEGWAATFDGVDRQGENFTDGAFQRGIKAFLSGPAALCFHHKHEKVLGKVLDLEEVEGKGLRMRARVDGAIRTHPELGTYYNQIKKGTLSALSVGGFFKRKLTSLGTRISDMDFTEISVTPVPVHSQPAFSVVAGKALGDIIGPLPTTGTEDIPDYAGLDAVLSGLDSTLDTISKLHPQGKALGAKGEWSDVYFLALLLKLEQQTNSITTSKDEPDGGAADERVDALVVRVKNYLDVIAREAHALAAELGPLPQIETC
jgi:HK97 family phage prohead protease